MGMLIDMSILVNSEFFVSFWDFLMLTLEEWDSKAGGEDGFSFISPLFIS